MRHPVKHRSVVRFSYEMLSELLNKPITSQRIRLGLNMEALIEDIEAAIKLPYPVLTAINNPLFEYVDVVLDGGYVTGECMQPVCLGFRMTETGQLFVEIPTDS